MRKYGWIALGMIMIVAMIGAACQPYVPTAPTLEPTASSYPEPTRNEPMDVSAEPTQDPAVALAAAAATAQGEQRQAALRSTAAVQSGRIDASRATATAVWQTTADAVAWQSTLSAIKVAEIQAAANATTQVMEEQRQLALLPLTLTPAARQQEAQNTADTLKFFGGLAAILIAGALLIIGALSFVTMQSARRMPDGTIVMPAFLAWIAGLSALDPLRATGPVVKTWMGRTEVPAVEDPDRQEQENRRAGFIRLTAAAAGEGGGGGKSRSKSELPADAGFEPPAVTLVAPEQAQKILDNQMLAAIDQDWDKKSRTRLAKRM